MANPLSFFLRRRPAPGPLDFLRLCRDGRPYQAGRLLEHGLSPEAQTPAGESLLDIAIRHRYEPLAQVLLLLGADPWKLSWVEGDNGELLRLPPFESALAKGWLGFCRDALSNPPPQGLRAMESIWVEHIEPRCAPAARSWRLGSGWLHLAVASDSPAICRLLRDVGVSPRLDRCGFGPLMACRLLGKSEPTAMEAYLAGSSISESDAFGRRPLDLYPRLQLEVARAEALAIEQGMAPAKGSSGRRSL